LHYNYLLFVVPFVFYAFGWAFHIILEMQNKSKYVFLSLLIAVTFVVDFLLALIISNNLEKREGTDGASGHAVGTKSIVLYYPLSWFLVYIIWSILLDSLLREWDKKEITDNLRKIIRHLSTDTKLLKQRATDLSSIRAKIADYRSDVSVLMHGNLKKIHRSVLLRMDCLPGANQHARGERKVPAP